MVPAPAPAPAPMMVQTVPSIQAAPVQQVVVQAAPQPHVVVMGAPAPVQGVTMGVVAAQPAPQVAKHSCPGPQLSHCQLVRTLMYRAPEVPGAVHARISMVGVVSARAGSGMQRRAAARQRAKTCT